MSLFVCIFVQFVCFFWYGFYVSLIVLYNTMIIFYTLCLISNTHFCIFENNHCDKPSYDMLPQKYYLVIDSVPSLYILYWFIYYY